MPPELDKIDPEMDQTGVETPDMGSDPMGAEGPEMGHGDQEGAMAKQELIKLANYATNLQEHIEDGDQLEAWVQSKITIAATNIASVYHYMAYEKKIGEYGDALENTPMSESVRRVITQRLVEAKEKVKELKKAQALKVSEEKSSTGGEITRTKTGLRHSHNPDRFSDEPHAEPASKVKARSASDKAGEKAQDKADEKESKAWGKANPGKQTIMKGGVKTTNESKMPPGHMAHHHACEYAKHHKAGNLELAMHHKEACESCGGTISHGPMGECCHTHPHLNNGQMYECGTMMMEAKSKMAKKDYDQDGKIESGKDEYLGSKIRAAKKAGNLKEASKMCKECEMTMRECTCKPVKESAKPSAGLSAAKKSATVKKAKAGGDIGKPGKSFDKVAKAAGGGKKGEKIAAAAMWKNIKETTAYIEKKKAATKNLPGKQEKIDIAEPKGKIDGKDMAALRAKKDTVKESTEFTRMQEQIARLNRTEKPMLSESREIDQLKALTNLFKG
jgi:hypothetical protein